MITPHGYVQYLLAIGHVHGAKHDTFNLLAALHNHYSRLPLAGTAKSISYPMLLLRMQLIEVTCQYVELLGSYSVACKETGLLYPHRVLSIGTGEVSNFLGHVGDLTDSDIAIIFNPNHVLAPETTQDIRSRYDRVGKFSARYRSLYNAIKHGLRVYPVEVEAKADSPGESGTLYVSLQWVHVFQGKDEGELVEAQRHDGTKVQFSIQKQEIRDDVFPRDDLSEYRAVVEDCHWIIEKILANNAPAET